MIKCKFCGAENPDGTKYCPSCGAKTESTVSSTTNNGSTVASTQPVTRKRNPIKGGILAWSIVNTVLGIAGCCTFFPLASVILGIIAIIYTTMAQDCQDKKEEKSKIKIATILNTIASAITILSIIVFITLLLIGGLSFLPHSSQFNIDEFLNMYPYID